MTTVDTLVCVDTMASSVDVVPRSGLFDQNVRGNAGDIRIRTHQSNEQGPWRRNSACLTWVSFSAARAFTGASSRCAGAG